MGDTQKPNNVHSWTGHGGQPYLLGSEPAMRTWITAQGFTVAAISSQSGCILDSEASRRLALKPPWSSCSAPGATTCPATGLTPSSSLTNPCVSGEEVADWVTHRCFSGISGSVPIGCYILLFLPHLFHSLLNKIWCTLKKFYLNCQKL